MIVCASAWAGDPDIVTDPNPAVIADLVGWTHPAKAVLKKHRLTVTKVELLRDRKYPVFHVASWPYDPRSSQASSYFNPLLYDLAMANGKWAYRIEDDAERIGYAVSWDEKTKTLDTRLVELPK